MEKQFTVENFLYAYFPKNLRKQTEFCVRRGGANPCHIYSGIVGDTRFMKPEVRNAIVRTWSILEHGRIMIIVEEGSHEDL